MSWGARDFKSRIDLMFFCIIFGIIDCAVGEGFGLSQCGQTAIGDLG